MINEVKINNKFKTPYAYIVDVDSLDNGAKFTFNEGVNIIVGANGSGKSTLINLIALYTLSLEGSSTWPSMVCSNRLERIDIGFSDGVDVVGDYRGKTYYYRNLQLTEGDAGMKDFSTFKHYVNALNSSYGQNTQISLQLLWEMAFNNTDQAFPIKSLKKNESNLAKQLIQYYKKNHKNGEEFTFLLDEPDRNLDIYALDDLYSICSYHKPNTQLIVVLHNPLLIYKLYKNCKDIYWFEMTPNYLNDLQNKFVL